MNHIHLHNRRAWDERARQRLSHTETASDKDFQNPMAIIDECRWLGGNVAGKHVLCLAAGGGKHSLLFAAAGAQVTVVEIGRASCREREYISGGAEREKQRE